MKKNNMIQGLDFSWDEINKAIKNGCLLSFDLEFSRACNLKCRYCYAGGKALPNELTFSELLEVIDQAVDLGAKNVVNIGGGEPLLYKYYWNILEYERKKGLKSITFTNGTLITKEIAKKLVEMKENIALKFNSNDENIQDYLAQRKDTGIKIKQALHNLLEVGYTKEGFPSLALETVITRQNYNEIEELYKNWRKQNILPYIEILTEQGLATESELGISPQEGKKLFQKLLDYDQKELGISWPLTPPIVGQTCKRMLYSAYIRSDGNVQPCPGVEIVSPDSNIRNKSLSWIIKNTEVFSKVRHIFDNLKGACSSCEHKNCYGCRGTALFQNNDYLGEDPTCWYIAEKAKMMKILNKFNIKHEIINHPGSGKTTAEAQNTLALPAKNILKCLLFRSHKNNYLGVIVSGDKKVNIKAVEKYFYEKYNDNRFKNLRMANKDEVNTILEYEVGGVPFTAFYNICDVICDDSLLNTNFIIGSGGSHHTGLKINPSELKTIYHNWGEISI